MDNRILLALAVAAFFVLISKMILDPATGWIEGVSIYMAILLIVSFSAWNDWMKDRQFVKLQGYVKDEDIAVIRGKYGATQSVNIYKLVVGDVILLETGSRIPADCILLEGYDITVNESYYYKTENRATRKLTASDDNYHENPDPFLLSQTLVMSGQGKAVVCCVGEHSRRGILDEKLDTTSKTPLQKKLDNLAATFTKMGIIAAFAILCVLILWWVIKIIQGASAAEDIAFFCENVTIAITIIVVAVPEGLPLTVAISLAYSVMRMKTDGILVKNLNAPEVMGQVEEICTGKTGTLTKSDMKVNMIYSQSRQIRATRRNTLFNCELDRTVIDLIIESILFNCEARIEMDEHAYYIPVGNGTEVGLIKFLQDAEVPVHEIIKRKLGRIVAVIPFSTIKKRSLVALQHPDNEEMVRVYVKGAPEYIVSKCVKTYDIDGSRIMMSDEQLNYILADMIKEHMTQKGLRAIALAYKDMSI